MFPVYCIYDLPAGSIALLYFRQLAYDWLQPSLHALAWLRGFATQCDFCKPIGPSSEMSKNQLATSPDGFSCHA